MFDNSTYHWIDLQATFRVPIYGRVRQSRLQVRRTHAQQISKRRSPRLQFPLPAPIRRLCECVYMSACVWYGARVCIWVKGFVGMWICGRECVCSMQSLLAQIWLACTLITVYPLPHTPSTHRQRKDVTQTTTKSDRKFKKRKQIEMHFPPNVDRFKSPPGVPMLDSMFWIIWFIVKRQVFVRCFDDFAKTTILMNTSRSISIEMICIDSPYSWMTVNIIYYVAHIHIVSDTGVQYTVCEIFPRLFSLVTPLRATPCRAEPDSRGLPAE